MLKKINQIPKYKMPTDRSGVGSTEVATCTDYKKKTPQERMALAVKHRTCWCCLRTGHCQSRCFKQMECQIDRCNEIHHPTLHHDDENEGGSHTEASLHQYDIDNDTESQQNHVSDTERSPGCKCYCLLQLMQVQVGPPPNSTINVMRDSGATVSMVTFKKARKLVLNGSKAKNNIVKVGGHKQSINSEIYDVPLYDTDRIMLASSEA